MTPLAKIVVQTKCLRKLLKMVYTVTIFTQPLNYMNYSIFCKNVFVLIWCRAQGWSKKHLRFNWLLTLLTICSTFQINVLAEKLHRARVAFSSAMGKNKGRDRDSIRHYLAPKDDLATFKSVSLNRRYFENAIKSTLMLVSKRH